MVNASDAPGGRYLGPLGHPTGGFQVLPPAAAEDDSLVNLPGQGVLDIPSVSPASAAPQTSSRLKVAASDQGPCLYFGPGGERCFRRAVRDGYCVVHLPPKPSALASPSDGVAADKPKARTVKIISAIAALLGFLAPMLDDLVRAILRWLHSH